MYYNYKKNTMKDTKKIISNISYFILISVLIIPIIIYALTKKD